MDKIKNLQILMLIALMFVTVFVFYPALKAGFINLDDRVMVTGNAKIRSLTAENIKSIFFEPHFKLYHPLVNFSYAIEYDLFGADPYFYHADNLILHLLNTLFVFFIFWRLSKNSFAISFITALIFACHPMHVEPVAWITGRKDTLYAFFFLASWVTYLKSYDYKDKKRVLIISASLTLFLCACLSKSMAVTLPAVLILCDWFAGKKFNKKAVLKYIPFFIIALIFSVITFLPYYLPEDKGNLTAYALSVNFVSAHFNVLFYMVKFLIPSKLSVIYPYFYDINSNPPAYILNSPALLYCIIFLILCSLKKTKSIFFGFAFFMITILPVVNILPTGISPVADRYTYIPFIGFGYIAASAAVYLYRKISKRNLKLLFASTVSAIMIIMCFTAHAKAAKWHNTKTLFDDVIKNYPGEVAAAYAIRGTWFKENGMRKEAEKDLRLALFFNKDASLAVYSLAGLSEEAGKDDEALELYASLPENDVNLARAYMYSAYIYYDRKKNIKTAHDMADKGLKLSPEDFFLNIAAGTFYKREKKYDEAEAYFKKAKKIFPDNSHSYVNLADIYYQTGKADKAQAEYIEAVKNRADDKLFYYEFGKMYFEYSLYENAEKIFSFIIKHDPANYIAYDYLGNICALKREYKKALYYFTLSILVRNDYAPAYFHRCAIYMETGNDAGLSDDAYAAKKLGFTFPEEFKNEIKEKKRIIL